MSMSSAFLCKELFNSIKEDTHMSFPLSVLLVQCLITISLDLLQLVKLSQFLNLRLVLPSHGRRGRQQLQLQ